MLILQEKKKVNPFIFAGIKDRFVLPKPHAVIACIPSHIHTYRHSRKKKKNMLRLIDKEIPLSREHR